MEQYEDVNGNSLSPNLLKIVDLPLQISSLAEAEFLANIGD